MRHGLQPCVRDRAATGLAETERPVLDAGESRDDLLVSLLAATMRRYRDIVRLWILGETGFVEDESREQLLPGTGYDFSRDLARDFEWDRCGRTGL